MAGWSYGGVVVWRGGRMAGWLYGGVVVWRGGRMAGWSYGGVPLYSGTPLIRPPSGHKKLTVLRGINLNHRSGAVAKGLLRTIFCGKLF